MSSDQRWHVPAPTMNAWVGGRTSAVVADTIEQHVMACAHCRAAAADVTRDVGDVDLEAAWAGVADRIEPQSPSVVVRLLRRVGVPEPDAVVAGMTPAFTAAWVAALTAVLGATLMASFVSPDRALATYLLLAPLVPLGGVALSYGEGVDPAYELTLTTPYPQFRLLLLRTAVVLVACAPLTILVGLALQPWWVALAWLAPGLAFVLATLAASTWWPLRYAAGVTGTLWVAVTASAFLAGDELAVVGPVAMAAYAGVVAAAGWVLGTRGQALSRMVVGPW